MRKLPQCKDLTKRSTGAVYSIIKMMMLMVVAVLWLINGAQTSGDKVRASGKNELGRKMQMQFP